MVCKEGAPKAPREKNHLCAVQLTDFLSKIGSLSAQKELRACIFVMEILKNFRLRRAEMIHLLIRSGLYSEGLKNTTLVLRL